MFLQNFSIKGFFSKYDKIQFPVDLVTFTEQILHGKLHFFCAMWKLVWVVCEEYKNLM